MKHVVLGFVASAIVFASGLAAADGEGTATVKTLAPVIVYGKRPAKPVVTIEITREKMTVSSSVMTADLAKRVGDASHKAPF